MTSPHSKKLAGQSSGESTNSSLNSDPNTNDALLPELLRHAQVRKSAPDEVKQRIKHQVKIRWQQNINQNKQRKHWFTFGSIATAMSVLLLMIVSFSWLQSTEETMQVAIYSLQGQVQRNNQLLDEKLLNLKTG